MLHDFYRHAGSGWNGYGWKWIGVLLLVLATGPVGRAQRAKDSMAVARVIGKDSLAEAPVIRKDSLAAVTVTGKKPFIAITPNKITLNLSESPIAAAGNVYEALLRAPGIAEENNVLSFRGRSVQVLINGRPSRLSGEDLKNMLAAMPAATIERIEILPNPSARYEAEGGTIVNVILGKNKAYGASYIISGGVGGGTWATENATADINYRNARLNAYGGYSWLGNKQYIRTVTDRLVPGGDIFSNEYDVRSRSNHGYKAGLDYDLSKHSVAGLFVSGYVNERKRTVSNETRLRDWNGDVDSNTLLSTTGSAGISSPMVNLYYKAVLDTTGKELTVNADYMRYHKRWSDLFTNRYLDAHGAEDRQPDYLRDNSPAAITVWSYSADYLHPVKAGRWEAGLRVNHTITDNDVLWENNGGAGWVTDNGKTDHFIYKETVNAAYFSHFRSFKKWSLEAGLRAEQTMAEGYSVTLEEKSHTSYTQLFPTISLGWQKSGNLQLGGSYKKSIQRFGFDYVNPFIIYQSQYSWSQGNPALRPQINHNFSLSASFMGKIWTGLDYTHSVNSLGISFRSQGNLTISSYDNFKSADIEYAYLSLVQPLWSFWQLNLNLSAGYFSYNLNTDTVAPQAGNQKPFVAIQWYNSFDLKGGWTVELNGSYTSSMVTGIFRRRPYYFTDAGIGKTWSGGRFTTRLSVTDMFNTQTLDMHTHFDGIDLQKKVKEESRFVNLTVKYRLGNKNVRANKTRQSKIADINNRIN